MDPVNFSPYALTLFNYKLFQNFKRLVESPNDSITDILSLKDLYEFIENNFAELHNKNNIINILPILHYTIQLEFKKASVKIDICQFFHMLMNKYSQNEDDQKIVLQLYYQLLKSLQDQNNQFISMTAELFQTFCDLLTSCSELLAANILNCLKLQITELKRSGLLDLLWQQVVRIYSNENLRYRLAQIMFELIDDFLQYIDNFYQNAILTKIVQTLLTSLVREERKIAIYMLKKIIPYTTRNIVIQGISKLEEINHSKQLNDTWHLYINTYKNLEKKQSNIIILKNLKTIKNIKLDKIWLDILYSQLLKHNNSLILRWTIEYMLDNFMSKDLSRELLKQILNAANTTNLYDYENYCLAPVKIKHFLNCDLSLFLDVLTDINWKSVPLHFWLKQLDVDKLKGSIISKETLIKIASKVRVLENEDIRGHLIQIFENCFEHQINALGIEEYFQLIDNLYNLSDYMYYSFDNLTKTVQNDSDNLPAFKLTQRLYEIVHIREKDKYVKEQKTLLDLFQNIPKEEHSWFRFMIVFDFERSEEQIEFCRRKYDLNLSEKESLNAFISPLVDKLVWDKSEESFVHEKAIDFFVQNCKDIREILDCFKSSNLKEIFDKGSKNTLLHVAKLIAASDKAIDDSILDNILEEVFKYNESMCYEVYQLFCAYIAQHMVEDKLVEYVEKILNNNTDDYYALKALLSSNVIFTNLDFEENGAKDFLNKIFLREATIGDARVEKRYEYELEIDQSQHFLHYALVDYVLKLENKDIELNFLHYVADNFCNECCVNNDLKNSQKHHISMRFGSCYLRILQKSKSLYHIKSFNDRILKQKNNQLDVTYLFDRIFAYFVGYMDTILKYLRKIRTYSPSQQVSIIVVCYIYCITKWSKVSDSCKNELIQMLLPLMMNANSEIRLYSQLVVYKILDYSEEHGTFTDPEPLKNTIHAAIGDQLPDLLNDIRLTVNSDINEGLILYVANAPFDEAPRLPQEIQEKYEKSRELFSKKINTTSRKNSSQKLSDVELCNEQKQINTLADIMPANDLISYPKFKTKKIKKNEVLVVAALIDKLPNLESVARTCKVLGIKNLVVSSCEHIDKNDFKNLSMTAEKELNITEIRHEELMEYLVQKQIEGYEIVGAEQTAKSQSIFDFKFPKKCIILLGHEKEGIPANIVSILNHAVEIPQFGALFMWEYYMQHIVSS